MTILLYFLLIPMCIEYVQVLYFGFSKHINLEANDCTSESFQISPRTLTFSYSSLPVMRRTWALIKALYVTVVGARRWEHSRSKSCLGTRNWWMAENHLGGMTLWASTTEVWINPKSKDEIHIYREDVSIMIQSYIFKKKTSTIMYLSLNKVAVVALLAWKWAAIFMTLPSL